MNGKRRLLVVIGAIVGGVGMFAAARHCLRMMARFADLAGGKSASSDAPSTEAAALAA